MPNLTLLTPVAPNHLPMLGRCIDSVRAQTATVEHLIEIDTERLGPGVIRNRLLGRVVTSYVSFLDADDLLEPDFAEKTLAVVGNKYIYTDWFQDGDVIQAPDCAWINKTFHLVTAVVPTAWALAVGGFDESLNGFEDTDFYVKLATRGYCGKRLPIPLVHYSADGGRASTIHQTGMAEQLAAEMQRRYGGMKVGCCGNNTDVPGFSAGERQPGDVLAMALWGGNRAEHGRATGRHYPRTSYPHTCYVDPRDVRVSPNLWRQMPEPIQVPSPVIQEIKPEPNTKRGLDALDAQMENWPSMRKVEVPAQLIEVDKVVKEPIARGNWTPDIAKVKHLAGLVGKRSDTLYFVRSDKDYPSYSDFWRLVELNGFQIASLTYAKSNLNNQDMTFIFVTPEGIFDCSKAKARCIFWQFEYAGEYANQKNRKTCKEQWSSDPYHAAQSGAKFVLLGSHPGLKTVEKNGAAPKWDIVTLSYLVQRRRTVYDQIGRAFAPDYPGHDGAKRDEQLSHSRLMLHVHQHDEPAIAPIKMALAAAYHLPVICEAVIDPGPYLNKMLFSRYENLPSMTNLYLDGKIDMDYLPDALYQLLCIEHPFGRCVTDALAKQEAEVAA